jgi:arginyl-tRNA synthetase
MLYVISSQQDLHTARFIKMLHLMEFPWASTIEYINYGLVLGMSMRKGTVVFLKQIIREAASVMSHLSHRDMGERLVIRQRGRTYPFFAELPSLASTSLDRRVLRLPHCLSTPSQQL